MAGSAAQKLTRWRSMSSAAASRSQRGISTMVPPQKIAELTLFCRPSRWNSGATARYTDDGCVRRHSEEPTQEVITVRCVCTQALGLPVVPEV
ncbi:hypothetical protein D3C87_1595740 [compost metagenome]